MEITAADRRRALGQVTAARPGFQPRRSFPAQFYKVQNFRQGFKAYLGFLPAEEIPAAETDLDAAIIVARVEDSIA